MLQQTDIYLQRLIALREGGFKQAELMQAEGRLDMGSASSCLLRAWAETQYAQTDGWYINEHGYPRWRKSMAQDGVAIDHAREYFGAKGIFGDEDLPLKRAYLDQLIAERMGVVA